MVWYNTGMVTTTATRIITNDLTAEQLTRAIQQLPLAFITEQGKSGSVYFKVMGDDRATFGVAWGGKGESGAAGMDWLPRFVAP